MNSFGRHIITIVLSFTLLVRFLAPSWGEAAHCDDQMFMQKSTCCQQLTPDRQQLSHGDCCCRIQQPSEDKQDMQVHIPSAELRFQPMVLALLDAITTIPADDNVQAVVFRQSRPPAYSSRHILALQSVLLI